jgi:hypothetical protein
MAGLRDEELSTAHCSSPEWPGASDSKIDDPVRQPGADHLEPGDGDWKSKSAWPGAARIQVQNTVADIGARAMRMPRNNGCEPGCLRVEVETREVVK